MATVAFCADGPRRPDPAVRRDAAATTSLRTRLPLDALAGALPLNGTEVRLVLLAGLAEEHEGLAGTLRSLHPLGEPRPSVGLAALVLAETGVDRSELRQVGEGPPSDSGAAVHRPGRGYERSLVLADGLWDVLHGVDATPSTLRRRPLGAVPIGLDHGGSARWPAGRHAWSATGAR